MENFSIYRYMKLGIVHFKAFPQVSEGDGPIVETLRKIVEDDFWTAVEVGWMKDVKVRNEASKLLETSHMEVCYANQPRMFSGKLNVNAFDPNRCARAHFCFFPSAFLQVLALVDLFCLRRPKTDS